MKQGQAVSLPKACMHRTHRVSLLLCQGATGMPSSSAAQLKDIPRWQSDCSPVIPLHERPQASSTSVQQLKAWYQDARQQSIAAAQRFDQPDDPSAADLLVGLLSYHFLTKMIINAVF